MCSRASLSRAQEAAIGSWALSLFWAKSVWTLWKEKSSLRLSHVFSPRTAVCFWIAEQHSQLAAINFFPNPASLLQIWDLATCSSYKWGTMGFCDGNADPSHEHPVLLEGLLDRAQLSHVPPTPPALLINYWSSTCPKLVLTGRAKGEWMEEFGVFNGCLLVLLYVFYTVWLKLE